MFERSALLSMARYANLCTMPENVSHPKRRGPRPSPNARTIVVGVRLSPDEWIEARRLAILDGVAVVDLLRRGIHRASHASAVDTNATRRSA